jgi:hypothetical protein
MKKFFTFLCAALLSAGTWADTAVLSWNLGENGAELGDAGKVNAIVGAAGSSAEGWTLAMTGNTSKNWSNGNGKIFLNGDSIMTLKNSNGVQITLTLPEGLYASQVEFYAVTNADDAKGTLKEFDGAACKDSVHSLKDYDNPTYIVKELELAKNEFTFTFGGKQVCFIAVVTYSNEKPVEPDPVALLSWMLGENGAEAAAANAITGAAGSLAEGWTIALTGNDEKNWGAGGKITYKGNEYKSLKNSNGVQITLTLPEGQYASQVEFFVVTNDNEVNGELREFDGQEEEVVIESLKDFANPTVIVRKLDTPKNEFTFTFGAKQVCFLAAVTYSNQAPSAVENIQAAPKAVKVIRNGQIVIIRDGVEYNALGAQL